MTGSSAAAEPERDPDGSSRRRRLVRAVIAILLVTIAVELAALGLGWLGDAAETTRAAPRFDPPVLAGQMVTGACSGGFYARRGEAIVLTISAHCSNPGDTLRDPLGAPIGLIGQRAQLAACPAGRFCAPSDFMALELAPDRIPWGHLNMVDMGAGGYRTLAAGTAPLACDDVAAGDRVEFNGRERFRRGTVLEVGRYEHQTDTIFPCMIAVDIRVYVGDSGGAVLVNGLPAGVVARHLNGLMGFTPLAEGLENLGLVLCTTPDCDVARPM